MNTTTDLTRRQTAATMRAIGQRRPRTTTAHFVCTPCAVTWSATQAADCWCCGQPATSEHTHRSTATGLLLNNTRPKVREVTP